MIERQTMGDAGATIMADERESLKTEFLHHLDLIQCHGALIIDMVIACWRLSMSPYPAQVGDDECVVIEGRALSCHSMPSAGSAGAAELLFCR
jgi:hypothetical protein